MITCETASSSDPECPNFENLKYEIRDHSDDIFLDDSCDPDVNFFNLKNQNLDSPCILLEEFQKFIDSSSHNSFSIPHLNIRNIKKNFDNSSFSFQYDLFFLKHDIKNCFGGLHKPLLHVFNLSIVKKTFQMTLKLLVLLRFSK